MRENYKLQPQNTVSESPKILYEKSLKETIRLNTDFNSLTQKENEYILANKKIEFTREKLKLNNLINNSINQRIEILYMNGTKWIGDSFFELKDLINKQDKISNEFQMKFYAHALTLMEELGYKGHMVLKPDTWLFLKKGNNEIQIKYHVIPVKNGLGKSNRIEKLNINKHKSEEKSQILCKYNREWIEACNDIETQKEIDAITATLG